MHGWTYGPVSRSAADELALNASAQPAIPTTTTKTERRTSSAPERPDRSIRIPCVRSGADLLGCPSLLRHLVGVCAFLGARGTNRTMRAFKTAVQAGVSQRTIAPAVAWQLIQNIRNLRSLLVNHNLPFFPEELPGQLVASEDRRQNLVLDGRHGMISRDMSCGSVHCAWTPFPGSVPPEGYRLRR